MNLHEPLGSKTHKNRIIFIITNFVFTFNVKSTKEPQHQISSVNKILGKIQCVSSEGEGFIIFVILFLCY